MSAVLQEPEFRMRPMSETDLTAVIGVEQEAYAFPWTEQIFHDCLRVGYSCWVMERNGSLVGYGVMSIGAAECHILNLCIKPVFQRQGFGWHLLAHLLRLAQKHRAETALLEVRPSNRAAFELYRQAGFNEIGIRRDYYPAARGREDAVILAKDLTI